MSVRLLAFYLPQYHPVPENDEWWGTGFTEWRNVVNAKPLFPQHYQPHLPGELGFYDLRLAEVRQAQADLARAYGIAGFCYYHYWFNGRRILERPFQEVLASGEPDFPFCLCWANENWTRIWDGGERTVLLQQGYSPEDDRAHIISLLPAFRDPRYIRIDGRPVFLVYRTRSLPDARRTAAIWREVSRHAGIGDVYLVRIEAGDGHLPPNSIGFDASLLFSPDGDYFGRLRYRSMLARSLAKIGLLPRTAVDNCIASYQALVSDYLSRTRSDYKQFDCVTPMWDNSARRKSGAWIYHGSTPQRYEFWLGEAIKRTLTDFSGEERLVFVNAWNEWAEGNHLEPDLRSGRAYLEATRSALSQAIIDEKRFERTRSQLSTSMTQRLNTVGLAKQLYWRLRHKGQDCSDLVRAILRRYG